jgi:hypothetical protein
MPRYVWLSPTNTKTQYVTALRNDPNVPAGFILTSGSDGAPDQALQQFVGGINSLCPDMRLAANANAIATAFYINDPTQDAVATALKAAGGRLWINGILGGGTGDK